MAIIVEDGTGLETSNSYCSVQFADNYHQQRGNTAWSNATTEAKEHALVNATDFVDRHFEFISQKVNEAQSLKFPRAGHGLPIEVQKATATYALFAFNGELYSVTKSTVIGEVKRQKSKVKAGEVERETETEFHGSGTVSIQQDSQFDAIKYLLAEFITTDHTINAQVISDGERRAVLGSPITRQRS